MDTWKGEQRTDIRLKHKKHGIWISDCRRMRLAYRYLMFVMLLFNSSTNISLAEAEEATPELSNLVKEASIAATHNLRSGWGKADYELLTQSPKETKMKLKSKGKLEVLFSDKKYHVTI